MSVTKDGKVKLGKEYFGEKSVLIAKSGYGKSYTARVIVEEGLKAGNTFIIVDPQDAYMNLPEFEYINAEDVKSARGLGVLLSQTNRNTIIRTKRLTLDDQNKFMLAFLTDFRKNIRKGIQTIVIDEIHKFAPEGQNTISKESVRGMFQENRSDGLGCIGITQRISRLDKTILSQADHLCIGRVTSFRDKESVKNYIDNPDDIEKISKLEKGEFYFYGFGLVEPDSFMVRKSETEHSGDSPKNLIREDVITYNKNASKYVKRSKNKMTDNVNTKNEIVNKIIPSMDGFMDLAKLGAKISIGSAVGGIAGTLVGARLKSPIPLVSSRSLGGMGTTVALYTGYRMIPNEKVKDVLKFACAGSAVYSLGSLAFDAVAFFGVKMPNIVNFAMATATGASPVNVQSKNDADTNTKLA